MSMATAAVSSSTVERKHAHLPLAAGGRKREERERDERRRDDRGEGPATAVIHWREQQQQQPRHQHRQQQQHPASRPHPQDEAADAAENRRTLPQRPSSRAWRNPLQIGWCVQAVALAAIAAAAASRSLL